MPTLVRLSFSAVALAFVASCGGTEKAIVVDLGASDLSAATGDASASDLSAHADLTVESSADMTLAPTFSDGVEHLFTLYSCFGCHMTNTWDAVGTGTSAAATIFALTMSKSEECPSLPYVTPGDPDKSYLYQKVMGAGSCFTGDRMPDGGNMVDAATIAALKGWIEAGAKND